MPPGLIICVPDTPTRGSGVGHPELVACPAYEAVVHIGAVDVWL